MQTRNMLTFISRHSPSGTAPELSADVVGYGLELPEPSEEHPHWEQLGVILQFQPDIPNKEWIVISKHDPDYYGNQWFFSKEGETEEDYFEFNSEDYVLPHEKYIERLCNYLRMSGFPQIAEKLPAVIKTDEWIVGRDYDLNDLITTEEIRRRLDLENALTELDEEEDE